MFFGLRILNVTKSVVNTKNTEKMNKNVDVQQYMKQCLLISCGKRILYSRYEYELYTFDRGWVCDYNIPL